MGIILCATRGGEASLRTQDAAIAKAKETGGELVFLYIYDVEFLGHAKYTLRSDVVMEELDRMGEFLMAMAIERAKRQNVPARHVVRHGDLITELVSAVKDEQATLVVLGRPGEEGSRFELQHMLDLADQLREETGVSVCILPDLEDDDSTRPRGRG